VIERCGDLTGVDFWKVEADPEIEEVGTNFRGSCQSR
jgi:hypothetical protein